MPAPVQVNRQANNDIDDDVWVSGADWCWIALELVTADAHQPSRTGSATVEGPS